MYSVRYGDDLSVETLDFDSARLALLTAEDFVAADRPHVVVTDTRTMNIMSFEELRELAEAEHAADR